MVICEICRREFKRITRTHLISHSTTTEDYRNLYPNSPIITDELRDAYGKHFRENNPMKDPEMQRRFSEMHTGKELSEDTRKKLSEAMLGKKLGPATEERKKKISESNKRTSAEKKKNGWVPPKYKMSEEAKERARQRMLGNTLGKSGHHNKGMKLNLTIEQRKNRSKKRTNYLSNNKQVKSNTKPELEFIRFLNENNIEFEHQYQIDTDVGSWLFDFYLPDLQLFVEIDGEYWHSKQAAIRRDSIKNQIIADLGKVLARISTVDLNFQNIFLDQKEIWALNYAIMEKRKVTNASI